MYINFESARVKEAEREAIKESRERILAEAESKYHKREAEKEKARLRGDDKWMLPSVEEKLSSSGKSKKKKKKEKKEKKSKKLKKRKRTPSSSSSSSSDAEEPQWVEKPLQTLLQPEKPLEREEWMNLSSSFLCSSREKKPKDDKKKQDTSILDAAGQSTRELNPYWKNGGTGVPEDEVASKKKNSPVMSVQWLKKSLQRAQEQAQEEGRSLEEIAKERWGSLEAIKSMIAESEKNSVNKTSRDWRNDKYSHKSDRNYNKSHRRRSRSRSRSRDRSRRSTSSSRSCEQSRRSYDDYKSNFESKRLAFKKPGDGDDDINRSMSAFSKKSESAVRSWRKPQANAQISKQEKSKQVEETFKIISKIEENTSCSDPSEPEDKPPPPKVLSDDELNKLGARIVKAEIMGDTELAEELKEQLKNAREAKKNNPAAESSQKGDVQDVILTTTNSKGLTKPLERRSKYEEPQGGRRKGKKVNAYEGGQRVRYFADDDKHSLKDMFEKEKGQSAVDDDKMFVKMASKSMDMDELFEEKISHAESDAKQDLKDKMRAIREHKRIEKTLENCRWCVDSQVMQKHLIVAMGSAIYLSLPAHVSLITGHCVLAPIHHVSAQTLLDEDVWDELKVFKKALTKMFREKNEYPVFFEVFMGRQRFPHMALECVPLPDDVGSMAPMYFKKALLECEMEWSTNKKLVELGQRDVKQAIPKGLPYFAVDFGGENGFAHVIEDKQMFPRNFAQEIIGGMLDLDSSMWRKPRREKFDQQKEKVLNFAEMWEKYDITSKK